jgi:hypothetical protein
VEGTDAFKLKVTLKNGDVRYYFMDTDYYVPIKIESKRALDDSRFKQPSVAAKPEGGKSE